MYLHLRRRNVCTLVFRFRLCEKFTFLTETAFSLFMCTENWWTQTHSTKATFWPKWVPLDQDRLPEALEVADGCGSKCPVVTRQSVRSTHCQLPEWFPVRVRKTRRGRASKSGTREAQPWSQRAVAWTEAGQSLIGDRMSDKKHTAVQYHSVTSFLTNTKGWHCVALVLIRTEFGHAARDVESAQICMFLCHLIVIRHVSAIEFCPPERCIGE